jgi:hypothetical protein
MGTVSASVHMFLPTLILPNAVSLPPELRAMDERPFFLATTNEWMTQRSFLVYIHFLLFELEGYRRELPIPFQKERFLLILDDHSSRPTVDAINWLEQHAIDVVVLPSHCPHLLPSFEVRLLHR